MKKTTNNTRQASNIENKLFYNLSKGIEIIFITTAVFSIAFAIYTAIYLYFN